MKKGLKVGLFALGGLTLAGAVGGSAYIIGTSLNKKIELRSNTIDISKFSGVKDSLDFAWELPTGDELNNLKKEIRDQLFANPTLIAQGGNWFDVELVEKNIQEVSETIHDERNNPPTRKLKIVGTDKIITLTGFAPYKIENGYKITVPSTIDGDFGILMNGNNSMEGVNKKLVIPKGVKWVDHGAFDGSLIEELYIPSTLVDIYNNAFANSPNLKKVIFDPKLKMNKFRDSVFKNCSSIETFATPGSMNTNSRVFGGGTFRPNIMNLSVNFENASSISYNEWNNNFINTLDPNVRISFSNIDVKEKILNDFGSYLKQSEFENNVLVSRRNNEEIEKQLFETFSATDLVIQKQGLDIVVTGLKENANKSGILTIPEGVTKIGNNAFANSKFSSVNLPSSLISIGDRAFSNSSLLKNVYFAKNSMLNSIGDRAFLDCISFNNLEINDNKNFNLGFLECNNLERIADGAFWGTKIGEIPTSNQADGVSNNSFGFLPSSVKYVGSEAFGKSGLTGTIVIPSNWVSIGSKVFDQNKINGVDFVDAKNLEIIGDGAFNTIKYTLPDAHSNARANQPTNNNIVFSNLNSLPKLKVIGDFAFASTPSSDYSSGKYTFNNGNQVSENTLVIPSSVVQIGSFVFDKTKISSVNFEYDSKLEIIKDKAFWDLKSLSYFRIPKNVKEIGISPFGWCNSLNTLESESKKFVIDEVNKLLIDNSNNSLIQRYGSGDLSQVNLEIPEGIEIIGDSAFIGAVISNGDIVIPSSIIKIDSSAFNSVFAKNANNKIVFRNNSNLKIIGDSAFLVHDISHFGQPTITGFNNLKKLEIIGDFAFKNAKFIESKDVTDVGNIVFNSNLIEIGGNVFQNCTINSVDFNNAINLEVIGSETLKGRSSTTIFGINMLKKLKTIGNDAFKNCSKFDLEIDFSSFEDLKTIGDRAFESSSVTNLSMSNSLISIGNDAFKNCISLASVSFGEGLKSIGNYAFQGCGFSKVELNEGLETVGEHAFDGCTNLSGEIELPSTVTNLGKEVFNGTGTAFGKTTAKWKINPNGKIEKTNDGLIINTNNKHIIQYIPVSGNNEIKIPSEVEHIDSNVFLNMTNVVSVNFNDASSLKTIGESAFKGCSNLNNLIGFENLTNLTLIGSNAFESCNKLTNIVIPISVIRISKYAFAFSNVGTQRTLSFKPNSSLEIIDNNFTGFENNMVMRQNLEIRGFENLTKLKSIGKYAFKDTKINIANGNTLKIPASVELINDSAFESIPRTSMINKIMFGNNSKIKTIGSGAFVNLKNLVEITIPESLSLLDSGVFGGCNNLKLVRINAIDFIWRTNSRNGSQYNNKGMFRDCRNLKYLLINSKNVEFVGLRNNEWISAINQDISNNGAVFGNAGISGAQIIFANSNVFDKFNLLNGKWNNPSLDVSGIIISKQ